MHPLGFRLIFYACVSHGSPKLCISGLADSLLCVVATQKPKIRRPFGRGSLRTLEGEGLPSPLTPLPWTPLPAGRQKSCKSAQKQTQISLNRCFAWALESPRPSLGYLFGFGVHFFVFLSQLCALDTESVGPYHEEWT